MKSKSNIVVIEKENGHVWIKHESFNWVFCKRCGFVRRADKRNKACRGTVRIRTRSTSSS